MQLADLATDMQLRALCLSVLGSLFIKTERSQSEKIFQTGIKLCETRKLKRIQLVLFQQYVNDDLCPEVKHQEYTTKIDELKAEISRAEANAGFVIDDFLREETQTPVC